jgi:hypothetical protein
MVEMSDFNSPQLVEAILVWTGWGREMMPNRDDSKVLKAFWGRRGRSAPPNHQTTRR